MTITPRRAIAAVAAIAVAAIGIATSPATAADLTVEPGGQVRIIESPIPVTDRTLEPASAGTLQWTNVAACSGGGLATCDVVTFVASPTFVGTATVRFRIGTTNRAVTVDVGVSSSNVDATFTPRPAPGPCIVVDTGSLIRFGDVVLGTPTVATDTTTIRGCTTIAQTVDAQVSDAQSNSGDTLEPVKTAPAPDQFRYELRDLRVTAPPDFQALDNQNTLIANIEPPTSTTPTPEAPTFRHRLTVASGSAITVGDVFSTTLTFTAVAD